MTFMAAGWFILLFGLAFIVSLILHLWLLKASTPVWQKMKNLVFIITFLFLTFCFFREDFGDAHASCVSPITIIAAKVGFIDHAYYSKSSSFGSLINFLWFPLIGLQVFGLVRIKKIRSTTMAIKNAGS